MGEFFDSLFNRDKYNAIKKIYYDLMAQYPQGLNIFLLQNGYRNHYPNDYSFNELIYNNSDKVKQLQEDFDAEERRRHALKSKVYNLTSNYPCGFGYYTYKHPNPDDEQICEASDEIKGYDKIILSVKKLQENNPDGFQYCAKAQGLLSLSLDPPYNSTSVTLINAMKGKTDNVKYYQRIHDFRKNNSDGIRLVIDADHVNDNQFLELKAVEIINAEKVFQDLMELKVHNPETVDLIIRAVSNNLQMRLGLLDLESIRQVLEFKPLFSDKDFKKSDFYKSLSYSQRKYILSLPSPMLQRKYLLKHFFSSKFNKIESAETEVCDSVVRDLLAGCKGFNIDNISYDTYFKTVSILSKDYKSIDSALSLINTHRHAVERFYNIEEGAALPFSALTDVYYNYILNQAIQKSEALRVEADKVESINRARKEQEERISRAKAIVISNSEAVSRLMPDININSLSSSQADKVIWKESELSILTSLLKKVASWERTRGIPHYFFYWYYPPKKYFNVSSESEYARKLIWNFKDGSSQDKVIEIVKQKLKLTFDTDCSRLTLVCVPASKILKNEIRYIDFADIVCEELHMTDAFEKIKITKEKTPSNQGGKDSAEYFFDGFFFSGRYVVLFDDVVTSGHSIAWFKNKLESFGAIVICAISIGRTYSDYYGDDRKPHPWSGIL